MQEAIVAVIVAFAFLAVAKRYMPKSARRTVRLAIARGAKKLGWSRVASKFEAGTEAASSCADGCGTCAGCGPADTASTNKQALISPETLRGSTSQSRKFH
jgi:hypothetical protein